MATVRIQVRRGTASQWTSANPTLAAGELGVESDTNLFKFGNGSTAWTALAYANNSDVAIGEISQDAINTALTMGSGLTKTYNDGSNTITITVDSSVVALKSYVDSAVTTHEADTTNVHGIADTSVLATATTVATAKSEAIAAAASAAGTALSTHDTDTTSVHGITNSADIVYLSGAQTLSGKTLNDVVLTGTPTAPTQSANDSSTKVATTAYVQAELADLIGAAPALLDTLSELSDALGDNENYAAAMTATITGINNTVATKLASADFTAHATDSTDVHGITNTANLVYTSDARLSDTRTPTAGSVTSGSMAADSIGTTSLLDSSVTTAKIAAVSVTEAKLANDSVTAAKIAAGAVGTSEIADLAVTAAKIAEGSVGSIHIADDAVGTAELAADSVTAAEIAAGAVGTSEIADLAVTSGKIATDAVGSNHIAAAAVGTAELGDDSVTAAKIAAGAVGTAELAADSVTTAKIADLNVTTGKINNSAITADKIESLAVTEGKLAAGAVTSGKIADGTIVNSDINASAEIETSKISGLDTALGLKAPLASPTFTGTVSGITKTMVGLGSADNTADTAKPVSTATQTALDLKAALASPTFTGTVSGITKTMVGLGSADNTADTAKPVSTAQASAIATAKAEAIADATAQVTALVTGAPAAMNTLDELAAALGDDANFASSVTTSLGLKAPLASPTFTGTVTVAASGVAFTDGTQTKEGIPSRTTIQQKTASYTLSALTERDNMIEVSSGSATTITVPLNSAVAYPVGTSIEILQTSTGQVTVAGASGVTINATPGFKLRTQWSGASLFKRAENTWVLSGDLTA